MELLQPPENPEVAGIVLPRRWFVHLLGYAFRRILPMIFLLILLLVVSETIQVAVHEWMGHALPAWASRGIVYKVALTPFGNGYVSEATYGPQARACVDLGGTVVEMAAGLAMLALFGRLRSRVGRMFGALFILGSIPESLSYLAYGIHYGVGDFDQWNTWSHAPAASTVLAGLSIVAVYACMRLYARAQAEWFASPSRFRRVLYAGATLGMASAAIGVLGDLSSAIMPMPAPNLDPAGVDGEGFLAVTGCLQLLAMIAGLARRAPCDTPRRLSWRELPAPAAAVALIVVLFAMGATVVRFPQKSAAVGHLGKRAPLNTAVKNCAFADIACDEDGRVWFVHEDPGRVGYLTDSNKPHYAAAPPDMLFDRVIVRDGDVYFTAEADTGTTVYRYDEAMDCVAPAYDFDVILTVYDIDGTGGFVYVSGDEILVSRGDDPESLGRIHPGKGQDVKALACGGDGSVFIAVGWPDGERDSLWALRRGDREAQPIARNLPACDALLPAGDNLLFWCATGSSALLTVSTLAKPAFTEIVDGADADISILAAGLGRGDRVYCLQRHFSGRRSLVWLEAPLPDWSPDEPATVASIGRNERFFLNWPPTFVIQ